MRFFTVLKCAFFGHVKFDMGGQELPTFVQGKSAGNETRHMHVCNRCDAMFVTRGALSEADLKAEAEHEAKVQELKRQFEERREELVQKLAASLKTGNKVELN